MKKQNAQPEYAFQKALLEWFRLQYPRTLFYSDARAAMKLSVGQAKRMKSLQKDGFKITDVMIFAARRGYHGLFLELKIESPFLKNGDLTADQHIQAQNRSHNELRKAGYYAAFVWEFKQAKEIIDWYLKGDA